MNHTLPTVALLVLLALPAGCGHQAPVREGGRVTLVEDSPPSERFVIQDLDETHLLVQPHRVELVRAEVKKFQERSQYVPER